MAKKMLALALAAALCCALFAVPASAVIPPPGAEETAAPNVCSFEYGGRSYSLVLGMYTVQTDKVDTDSGSVWPVDVGALDGSECPYPYGTFAVTIFENLSQPDQAEVPAALRDELIESVAFSSTGDELGYIYNIAASQSGGRWCAQPYLRSVRGGSADLTATVHLAEGCSVRSADIKYSIGLDVIPGDVFIDCAAAGITTQEALQEFLDEEAPRYGSDVLGLYLRLAPADYGDIVFRAADMRCDVLLMGAVEQEGGYSLPQTTMSSLRVETAGLSLVSDVKFESDGGRQTAMEFSAGTNGMLRLVSRCSFSGYRTAVSAAEGAGLPECSGCLFLGGNGNSVGLSIAAEGGLSVYDCAFIGCRTGVELTDMPGGSIAYDYRIYHCDFINHNSGNRDIVSDREVYAAGNYLDHASDKRNSSELRYLSPSGLADHLMYIFGYSDAPAPAPDWTESYVGIGREADGVLLSQDETLFPQGLLLDGASFGRESALTIGVAGEGGSVIGTWIFGGEEG